MDPAAVVEKNAENTAGNGALVNGTSDGIGEKPPQHGQNPGPAPRSELGGGPVVLSSASGGGDDQAPSLPEKTGLKYPNLGSRLNDLVVQVEEEQASAKEAAAYAPVHRERSVAVTIHLDSNVEEVVSFLEQNGGDPRNAGEDHIEAYVPATLLGRVSEQPGVIRVREIIPPEDGRAVDTLEEGAGVTVTSPCAGPRIGPRQQVDPKQKNRSGDDGWGLELAH